MADPQRFNTFSPGYRPPGPPNNPGMGLRPNSGPFVPRGQMPQGPQKPPVGMPPQPGGFPPGPPVSSVDPGQFSMMTNPVRTPGPPGPNPQQRLTPTSMGHQQMGGVQRFQGPPTGRGMLPPQGPPPVNHSGAPGSQPQPRPPMGAGPQYSQGQNMGFAGPPFRGGGPPSQMPGGTPSMPGMMRPPTSGPLPPPTSGPLSHPTSGPLPPSMTTPMGMSRPPGPGGQPSVNGVTGMPSPSVGQPGQRPPPPPQVNGLPTSQASPNMSPAMSMMNRPPLPGQSYQKPGFGPPQVSQQMTRTPMGLPPPPRVGMAPPPGIITTGPGAAGDSPMSMGNQPGGVLPPPRMGGPPADNMSNNVPSAADSEPTSQKSSRAPSPISGSRYDVLEGQFTAPSSQPGSPPGQVGGAVSSPPSVAPTTGGAAGSGITGRRQYPQMSGQMMAPPAPMPGPQPGVMNDHNYAYQQPPMSQPQPPQPQPSPYTSNNVHSNSTPGLNSSFNNMRIQTEQRMVNLLQEKQIIPPEGAETSRPVLNHDFKKVNCNPDIFRCTLNAIPQTQSLLHKSRLPLGILIHPFKDLSQLPVIQSSVIVRCRSCRTYINPFVSFVDLRRWKCNLCYRINELPEEFSYDPVSKTYGEPQRRPEIRSATIEFIAPSEYMLRPPQAAVYLFVLDVSFNAIETGYLQLFCQTVLNELDRIPGDSRTSIGFITFDSSLHFYNLAEGLSQPQMLIVSDVDDIFLPSPDSLLVNLHESRELVVDLLNQLPTMFAKNTETGSALGPALQASYKLLSSSGGRVSVFLTQLPNAGPGGLKHREDPNERAGKNISHLGPANDFYKKLALDCSAQQIAVDLFFLNGQYADLATVACASKYSGGCVQYYPNLHTATNPAEADRFENDLRRYITRKIGFEAVMRIRCTKGLSIHTFHGNFFVRSTDLLSLPNINPDSGFGMQISIEDTLNESSTCCFQAALLYTSSKGERRIRVHTLCMPVTTQLSEVFVHADQHAITGLLAKMAVDRSMAASIRDAREALINAASDMLSAFGNTLPAAQRIGTLPCTYSLRLMAVYVLAMLKSTAFRVGTSTKLDDRVFAMEQCKSEPLNYMMLHVYPDLYPVHALDDKNAICKEDTVIPQPPVYQLSAANVDRHGAYLMDTGTYLYLWIGGAISDRFCVEVLDVPNFQSIRDGLTELPNLDNPTSDRLRNFVNHLQDQRPFYAALKIIREDSRSRMTFVNYLVEDRTESSMSYYEFLQYLQKEVKS